MFKISATILLWLAFSLCFYKVCLPNKEVVFLHEAENSPDLSDYNNYWTPGDEGQSELRFRL